MVIDMNAILEKAVRRQRRKMRIRKKVYGTPECPRLTVFRSVKHIYAQLIDDTRGETLVAADSRMKDFGGGSGGNVAGARRVGQMLGERAKAQGIARAAFDRNGYKYHGRVKALADAAREAGLKI
ncbi:MAG: 50S ribosomal protein L18 [Phycisphaerae bacterium]